MFHSILTRSVLFLVVSNLNKVSSYKCLKSLNLWFSVYGENNETSKNLENPLFLLASQVLQCFFFLLLFI